jgi:hypothetical protein
MATAGPALLRCPPALKTDMTPTRQTRVPGATWFTRYRSTLAGEGGGAGGMRGEGEGTAREIGGGMKKEEEGGRRREEG